MRATIARRVCRPNGTTARQYVPNGGLATTTSAIDETTITVKATTPKRANRISHHDRCLDSTSRCR